VIENYSHQVQTSEVFPQKGDGVLRAIDAQLNDAFFQYLLDVVALHVRLTFPQTLLFVEVGRHLGLATLLN
jgi:hypothetical protein